MTIQQLRYVLAIAEAGSLNKEAELLYIAQPSLTASVKELENELGITLFTAADAVLPSQTTAQSLSHMQEMR